MKSFQDLARKNFSYKFQGHRMLWTLALKKVRDFFQDQGNVKLDQLDLLEWYIKYRTLFLHTSDPYLKIQIFKDKSQLLKSVNDYIACLGYDFTVKDIRLQ